MKSKITTTVIGILSFWERKATFSPIAVRTAIIQRQQQQKVKKKKSKNQNPNHLWVPRLPRNPRGMIKTIATNDTENALSGRNQICENSTPPFKKKDVKECLTKQDPQL